MITLVSHGKTILTGEHAVIRGAPAVVVPNLHQTLTLTYDVSKPFKVICNDQITSGIFNAHLSNLWLMGQKFMGGNEKTLSGELNILNNIPIARGCGFSAAFSVVIAKLIHHVYEIESNTTNLFELSLYFENHFHGNSSGADIAGAMALSPIWFHNRTILPIECNHKGYFYLFDSLQTSHTKQCVAKVSQMKNLKLDNDMSLASGLMLKGLQNESYSLELICQSMQLANACFEQWGLITPEVISIQNQIATLGGIASKVTGAGSGGFVLGYFENLLPKKKNIYCQNIILKT